MKREGGVGGFRTTESCNFEACMQDCGFGFNSGFTKAGGNGYGGMAQRILLQSSKHGWAGMDSLDFDGKLENEKSHSKLLRALSSLIRVLLVFGASSFSAST